MNAIQLKTLGEKFIALSVTFLLFIEKHNLDETIIDMDEADDTRRGKTPLCKTPLCHGGWLAVMFEGNKDYRDPNELSFFAMGAVKAAKYLGFKGISNLESWARLNPSLWGNTRGGRMFYDKAAFGIPSRNTLMLSDIANHYAAVGQRCIEASEKLNPNHRGHQHERNTVKNTWRKIYRAFRDVSRFH